MSRLVVMSISGLLLFWNMLTLLTAVFLLNTSLIFSFSMHFNTESTRNLSTDSLSLFLGPLLVYISVDIDWHQSGGGEAPRCLQFAVEKKNNKNNKNPVSDFSGFF